MLHSFIPLRDGSFSFCFLSVFLDRFFLPEKKLKTESIRIPFCQFEVLHTGKLAQTNVFLSKSMVEISRLSARVLMHSVDIKPCRRFCNERTLKSELFSTILTLLLFWYDVLKSRLEKCIDLPLA